MSNVISVSTFDRVDVQEDQKTEFKRSIFISPETHTPCAKQMHVIAETLAAFMNAEGGMLYIGVNDGGQPFSEAAVTAAKKPKALAQTSAPAATQIPVAQPDNMSGDGLTEAKLSAMKKPTALMFDGAKVANVGTWKDLFQKLIEKLNELYPAKFDTLAGDSQFGKYFMRLEPGKKTPRDFFKIKLGSDGSVRAKEQANKVYLWRQDYYFRKLLSKLGVDAARIEVI